MYNTVVWGIFTEVCKHHNLIFEHFSSFQFSHSVVSDSATPWNQSTAGLSVHHQLLEFTQTHGHQVGDAIHPSHPLSSPCPLAPNPTQHQVWELDCEESWVLENWCFWTVVLEKTLESPLDCKEIQPVHPKADQSWVFIGRTDAEAETPILWPDDAKNWLIGKDPGKDWKQEEKGTTEVETVGCCHWLNGHEFEWTLGVGDGQGGLVCCSP